MGAVKKAELEAHERARQEELDELKRAADAAFPGEDWDAEDYEAYLDSFDKD